MIVREEEAFWINGIRATRNMLRLKCDDCGVTSTFSVLADVGVTGERLREYIMSDLGGKSWRVHDGLDICPFCRLLREPVAPGTENLVARVKAARATPP